MLNMQASIFLAVQLNYEVKIGQKGLGFGESENRWRYASVGVVCVCCCDNHRLRLGPTLKDIDMSSAASMPVWP